MIVNHINRLALKTLILLLVKSISVFTIYYTTYCWRSRDELIRDVLLWIPTHGRAKAGRPARTYIQQLCEDTGCPEDLPRAMNDREEWRERVRDIRATSAIWWWWWWYYIHYYILYYIHPIYYTIYIILHTLLYIILYTSYILYNIHYYILYYIHPIYYTIYHINRLVLKTLILQLGIKYFPCYYILYYIRLLYFFSFSFHQTTMFQLTEAL